LTEFGKFVEQTTQQVRTSIEGVARAAGRPVEYLSRPSLDKEAHARGIAQRDGIREGLIAVLYAVEPCRSFRMGRDPSNGHIEVFSAWRKCLHYYSYWMHPQWGLCHVRVQTWFPMGVHVCLNGREWLARQLDAEEISYQRRDNCLVRVADASRAQTLLDEQVKLDWPTALEALLRQSHPGYVKILGLMPGDPKGWQYYWSADQSEWATDVMFRSPQRLAALYPRLVEYAMLRLGSREVLRFLGRPVPQHGGVHGKFKGEVTTDLRQRRDGIRIKHRIDLMRSRCTTSRDRSCGWRRF